MFSLNYEFIHANRVLIFLMAVLLLSAFCRLYGLNKQSLEGDEFYTVPASIGRHYRFQSNFQPPPHPVSIGVYRNLLRAGNGEPGLLDVTDVLRRNVHAPLYFYFMHYWIKLFGTSEAALRFPSAVCGILSVIMIFLLGRELFNPFVGLFSSMLCGLMPEQIYQSLNARMYSLLVLLAISSTYMLVSLLRKRPSIWGYLLYGIISVAGLYTHYVYLFCFAAQTLYVWTLFRRRKEIRFPWIVTQLCIGAAFAPWLIISWSQKQTSSETLMWVSGKLSAWEIFLVLINKVSMLVSVPEVPLGWLGQLVAFILILFGLRALSSTPSILLQLGLWIIIPVAGILVGDRLNATAAITATRYWMIVSPALYLLMAVGAQRLNKRSGQVLLLTMLTLILSIAAFGTAVGSVRKKPYDYREMAYYIDTHIQDADNEIVLTEGSAAVPLALAYYGRRDTQVWRLSLELNEPSEERFLQVMQTAAEKQNVVWLLSNQTDGAAKILEQVGYKRDDSQTQFGPTNVYQYLIK